MKQIWFGIAGVVGIALAAQSDALAACGDGRPAPSVDDISRLLKAGGLEKGEFETSSQFRARTAQSLHNFLEARYDSAISVSVSYDADRGIVTVPYAALDDTMAFGNYQGIRLGIRFHPEWAYDGENAFGIHKNVIVAQSDYLSVLTDRWPFGDSGSRRFKLSIKRAKDVLSNLSLRVVGSPVAPIKFETWYTNKPTITSPYEYRNFTRALIVRPTCIALVDQRTRNVVYELWHR